MKFVALLSGGKDSVFCLEKCLSYGHELVCAANLHPPSDPERNGDEINSYMYQSAAFSAVPKQAECLGVPLIRREIVGEAKLQTLNYDVTENDETEDLFKLLEDVKARFPDVMGVSCGTIISSYQRFRVENICQRLGLTPLTYLWQRDRRELLQEMLAGGLEAVLVKTAGAGLVPDKHLGKSLRELHPTLLRLHDRFELDLCGEGGEYESLVLDSRVFCKSLVLTETVIHYDAEDDSVGCLRVISCETREKHEWKQKENQEGRQGGVMHTPHLFRGASGMCQTGLLLPPAPHFAPSSPEQQLHTLLHGLSLALQHAGHGLKDAVFVHLYVADMRFFHAINEEYGKWFGYNPPSRSCVQCTLPHGVHVAMECLVLVGSHDPKFLGVKTAKREVLHVRSVSAWAPVCIGPYAQANIIHDSIVFVAGQIALQPSTMTMLEDATDDSAPWHSSFIDSVIGALEQSDRLLASSRVLLTGTLRELFLSLFHVNSILSALAGNTPSLPLSPSASLLLLIYVDVRGCASKYWNSLEDTERSTCAMDELVAEVHALFETIKSCAALYIENFVAAVTEQRHAETKSTRSDSDGSDDDNGSGDIDGCEEKVGVPVLVVGVDSLPRGALVEVEFTGATAALQLKPRITRNHSCSVSHSALSQSDSVDTDSSSAGTALAPLRPPAFLSVDSTEVVFPDSLCTGVYSINVNPSTAGEMCVTNSSLLAGYAAQHLKNVMSEAGMNSATLRVVRVFVPEMYLHVLSDVQASIVRAWGEVLKCFSIDPVVIPVAYLTAGHIVAIQFLCEDDMAQNND